MNISPYARWIVGIAAGIGAVIGTAKTVYDLTGHLNGWHVLAALSFLTLLGIGIDGYHAWISKKFATISSDIFREANARSTALDSFSQDLTSSIQRLGDIVAKLTPVSLPLKQRTINLANDLFALLQKHGPRPPHPLSGRGSEEEQRRVFDAYFKWEHRVYYVYMAYFRDRTVKIDYELAAEGFSTKLDEQDIDPPVTSHDMDIQKIAEALLLTASHMPDTEAKSTSAAH